LSPDVCWAAGTATFIEFLNANSHDAEAYAVEVRE
jgi:hypothetical protein